MVDSMTDQSRSAPIVLGKRKEMMASRLGSSQREFEEAPVRVRRQVICTVFVDYCTPTDENEIEEQQNNFTGFGYCAIVIHCTPADQIVEQQERCSKYSQQAIGFAISTYSGFLVSPKPYSTGDTVVKIATSAAFFVAIIADLVSWRMKPRWGRALVYISSFHLMLMTFGIFVSFDKDYGYLILLVLLIIMIAATLQRKIWHGVWQQSRDDNTTISQDLDLMFDLSALILNLDSIITMITTISGHFPSGLSKYEAAKTTGFLLFSTIVLSLYLMMVATVRTVALTVTSMYLDVLLMVLLVSTLIATSITFIYFLGQTLLEEGEVPT
ncbi:uncharacterized protein [Miscanthus floridulus]|uniref:uncharacterized protein n=1 Tax=Miscanthus floridulus TaxID=154761 RepID=UPI003458D153